MAGESTGETPRLQQPARSFGVDSLLAPRFNFAMRRSFVALALTLAACAKNIPNTDIRDTSDTRAILDVIEKYRYAAERRDAAAVVALVSTSYFDDAGTPDPSDDLDYGQLQKALVQDYQRLPAVRLDLGVKQIEVDGDKAFAIFFYDTHFRVATPRGEVPKQNSDQSRMMFRKEGGAWKITSGL
jgi:ketosteroid isomerase-like protein